MKRLKRRLDLGSDVAESEESKKEEQRKADKLEDKSITGADQPELDCANSAMADSIKT